MGKIISIHAVRRGTGKSTIAANIATVLAASGQRVGLIDSDTGAPGLHSLFAVDPGQITTSLNMFLWGQCGIADTAYEVTSLQDAALKGAIYLIPFVIRSDEIDYDISLLSDSFQLLMSTLRLDVLLIDVQPGLNDSTLPPLAFADAQVMVLRPDLQDYQGTSVAIDIGGELGVPDRVLIVNLVPPALDPATVRQQVERAYGCRVIAVLPQTEALAQAAQSGLFVLHHPQDSLTRELTQAAALLLV